MRTGIWAGELLGKMAERKEWHISREDQKSSDTNEPETFLGSRARASLLI